MNTTFQIKDFSEFNEPWWVRLTQKVLAVFPKSGFLDRAISSMENKLIKSVTAKWSQLDEILASNADVVEQMPTDRAIKLRKEIQKVIQKVIDLHESFEKDDYHLDESYKQSYKSFLRTLGKTDNILHRKITKNNPVQKTSESLRQGVASISMESFSKKFSM